MREQGFPPGNVFVEKDNDNHQISSRCSPNHQCPDKTFLVAQVEERVTFMLQAIIFDFQSDSVGNVVLQPTFVDVEYFVEHAGDMETEPIHTVERFAGCYLLFR